MYGRPCHKPAGILKLSPKVLRRHMLDHKSTFDGTFQEGCIQDAIPPTLLQFVGTIEHGADIKYQLRLGASKSDLAMSQLLQYNCYARYKEGTATHQHSRERETPFPLHMDMSVLTKTRKRQLVEMLHDHIISISYDRVLEVSAQLGDAAVPKYVEDGVVCPPDLRRGLFTTTSTAIQLLQHQPLLSMEPALLCSSTQPQIIKARSVNHFNLETRKQKTVLELPASYTNIHPELFRKKNLSPPRAERLIVPSIDLLKPQLALEYEWLEKVCVPTHPKMQHKTPCTMSRLSATKDYSWTK